MTMASGGSRAGLLDRAYRDLELDQGLLIEATPHPTADSSNWDAVGEWLMLAHRTGAERVFFVGDDPVIVFTRLAPTAGDAEILNAYRRAWSLARPHCLFLSTRDELRVYALNAPPVRSVDEADRLKPIEIVSRATDVAELLAPYHRDGIESGELFGEKPYKSRAGRADTQLLDDVRTARNTLVEQGLPHAVAHALIERAILIRYLEDRSILTREYFAEVAGDNEPWMSLLRATGGTPEFGANSTFVSCLRDRDFAYAVFKRLEADFNGDLFRVERDERDLVQQDHLELVNSLLTRAGLGPQKPLFLWAYDFSVVPTSLISSMYEQFYRAGTDDDSGTHYTPPELVEYVLGRVLADDVLKAGPRICDPACGSGIFLVEAYRRLVRHARVAKGRPLGSGELRELLLGRIVGVDVNPEAIRLAAFSLYLAYLNYLDPSDILQAGPLPPLIRRPDAPAASSVLVAADAFAPTIDEDAGQGAEGLPWRAGTFDVVVGNPPWSKPPGGKALLSDEWARKRDLAVGERNPSQKFLWRALSLLRPGGISALLVSTTAIHNIRGTSKRFRSLWLQKAEMREVVDFTSSRSLLFDSSIAPFMLLVFQPRAPERDSAASGRFLFSSARPSRSLQATRSLAHAQLERRWAHQDALASRDYLWKTYAWGNHHDLALMARLDAEQTLEEFLPADPGRGYGYQGGKSGPPTGSLRSLRTLDRFDFWGPLSSCSFKGPPAVLSRQPDESRYSGRRIVVGGIKAGFGPPARLETEQFAFERKVYCLPMDSVPLWQAETILGTLLSALGRYRLFMASGSWGVWRDKIYGDDILALPIRMAAEQAGITTRISDAVRQLPRIDHTGERGQLPNGGDQLSGSQLEEVMADLDEAVFDLFEATEAERDLVRDFMDHTLPLVGRKNGWFAQPTIEIGEPRHGRAIDLDDPSSASQIDKYLRVFLGRWNRELAPEGEFAWLAVGSPRAPMIAVVLETRNLDDSTDEDTWGNKKTWSSALERLDLALDRSATATIRESGTLRSVGDTSIVIAKRNEARLWTVSAAREDAEATILQAINLQHAQ